MKNPFLIEEARNCRVPASLVKLFKDEKVNKQEEALIIIVHLLMTEGGFENIVCILIT